MSSLTTYPPKSADTADSPRAGIPVVRARSDTIHAHPLPRVRRVDHLPSPLIDAHMLGAGHHDVARLHLREIRGHRCAHRPLIGRGPRQGDPAIRGLVNSPPGQPRAIKTRVLVIPERVRDPAIMDAKGGPVQV